MTSSDGPPDRPTPTPQRPAYRRLSADVRRGEIIAAALALFGQRPPEDVTVDDIAAAAGASRPSVYRYFATKQDLYEAAVRSAADELRAVFAASYDGPLLDQLTTVVHRFLDYVADHGPGYAALLRGVGPHRAVGGSDRLAPVLEEVREFALGRILAKVGAADPGPWTTLVLRTWLVQVETAALWWLAPDGAAETGGAQSGLAAEELAEWLVDQFVGSLAVTASRDPLIAWQVRTMAGQAPGAARGVLERVGALAAECAAPAGRRAN